MQSLHAEITPVHNKLVREMILQIHEEEKKNILMQQEIRNLEEQNAQIQELSDTVQEAYSVVTNSTIWKTTKPLRKFLDRMKH